MKKKRLSKYVALTLVAGLASLSACNDNSTDWNAPTYGQKPDSVRTVNGATYHGFYSNGLMTWFILSRTMNGGYGYNSYPYSFSNNRMVPVSAVERVGGFGRSARFGGVGE